MECHCLFIQSAEHRILIDTGLSEAELHQPRRLGPFARALGLRAEPQRAARTQLQALGVDPSSITDIVLTHLDLDHAGGVADFPQAKIHVHLRELGAAQAPKTLGERWRYRPNQWAQAKWVLHGEASEGIATSQISPPPEGELEKIPVIQSDSLEVALVPLFGHTRGHCGVWVRSQGETLLHCGDSYYDSSELHRPSSFFFRCFQSSIHECPKSAKRTLQHLQGWSHKHASVKTFCSHDPEQFAHLGGKST